MEEELNDMDALAAPTAAEDETITVEVDESDAQTSTPLAIDDEFDDSDVFLISVPARDSLFSALLGTLYDFYREDDVNNNDTYVRCADGAVRAPSVLLAAVSPVFRAAAGIAAPDANCYSLVLPEITVSDFGTFLLHLCRFHVDDTALLEGLFEDRQAVESVMDLLSSPFKSAEDLDVEMPPITGEVQKRSVRRKRKAKENTQPYVKTEVLETPRQETSYSLRRKIKRTRFSDEVSEPSDLEDDDEDLSSLEATSDYEPEGWEEQDEEEENDGNEEESDEDGDLDEDPGERFLDDDDDPEEDEDEFMAMFTVKLGEDGQVEVLNDQQEDSDGIGRVVFVMEGEEEIAFQGTKLVSEKSTNPRSLLKSNLTKSSSSPVLFCSVCEKQFSSMSELRHHVAQLHKGSKFFLLPPANPHRDCGACKDLLKSYEELISADGTVTRKDVCFSCPHCRRRFAGRLKSLASHLINDHRNVREEGSGVVVLRMDDARALRCDFCQADFGTMQSLNRHLISCPKNTSGHSAGLHCIICGKMFAEARHLKDHMERHGSEWLARNFPCPLCPVACASEVKLQKHTEKEHESPHDQDEIFILHDGCDRCNALILSYRENKTTQVVAQHNLAFKCPHCCMILYAHQKHAPRYLLNHINKFHMDPEVNEFSLGSDGPSAFRVLSKTDLNTLKCDFCGHQSGLRQSHNAHLSVCKASTVPCRPGYMCDSCGHIAGTSRQLRTHLESHVSEEAFLVCDWCEYAASSSQNLKNHVRKKHSRGLQRSKRRKRSAATGEDDLAECPNCGKEKRVGPLFNSHVRKCTGQTGRVKCTDCEMEFKRKEDMQAHALIHYGQITCPIHNILFKYEKEVFQHVNKADVDNKVPRLQCCMCNSHFRHMCHFMKHIRRHLKIQPYRCGVCQKHFNTYASLQVHQQNIHGALVVGSTKTVSAATADKLFHCELCSKLFNTKGHLKEHVEGVHDRGNTVTCPVCQKSFSTYKRMKKHLFNSHKELAEQYRSRSKVEVFADA